MAIEEAMALAAATEEPSSPRVRMIVYAVGVATVS